MALSLITDIEINIGNNSLNTDEVNWPLTLTGTPHLLIAALSAKGKSIIHNIEQIDRGYEKIVEKLSSLGAKIKRI